MEQVTGYPSFVRHAPENTSGLDWWSPVRSGDAEADFRAGEAHFETAMKLLKGVRDPGWREYYAAMMMPDLNPFGVLPAILGAMQDFGPIEHGFVTALSRKAIAGRIPPRDPTAFLDHDAQIGEQNARACLLIGRSFGLPDLVADALMKFITRSFDGETSTHFVWVVCTAAAAGALN